MGTQWTRRGMIGAGAALSGLALAGRSQAEIGKSTIPQAPFVEVEIASGKIRGGTARGALVFKGIPYAGSVSGANRFKAPPPVTPWTGVFDATKLGPPAQQTPGSVYGEQEPAYSEDCLVLNVWTPAVGDGGKRPVLFYLHGGGYAHGSAGSTSQDGGRLAAVYDAVVVACNHRLGLAGFLYLGEQLGQEYSGNAAMQDMVAALQWVRENIAVFGGDSGNVMIFGESGGGAKVGTLLGMPSAHGLFHKAGIQSGAALRRMPKDAAAETALRLMKAIGVTDARKLFDVPIQTLLELQWAGEKGQGALAQPSDGSAPSVPSTLMSRGFADGLVPGRFGPVVDGHVLPEDPYDGRATAVSADIPLLIGHNKDEATFFFMGQAEAFTLDEAGLKARLDAAFGEKSGALLAVYRQLYPSYSPSDLYIAIVTARTFGNDTATLAALKSAQPAPVYTYRWDYPSNFPIVGGNTLKAGHATDIGPTFYNWDLGGLHGNGPGLEAAARNLSGLHIAFARTGKPNLDSMPDWPRYEAGTRPVMRIDEACTLASDPEGAARAVWETI